MISEALRNETADHHKAIENAKRFSRLGSPDFTREEYVETLERFYGFYRPLEAALTNCSTVLDALDYERRWKLPLLREDLLFFGHTDESLKALPVCTSLPPLETPAQVVGCVYVMEGSTHGAQFIARRLREQFGLDEQGVVYYAGYGKDTMSQWQAFKTYLDGEFDSEQDGPVIVASASATFNALHQWMDT